MKNFLNFPLSFCIFSLLYVPFLCVCFSRLYIMNVVEIETFFPLEAVRGSTLTSLCEIFLPVKRSGDQPPLPLPPQVLLFYDERQISGILTVDRRFRLFRCLR
jgi:hypothetical protein